VFSRVFSARRLGWRGEAREDVGNLQGCGGSEEAISVGLGMMLRL
jgi:hypothetical protein